MSEEVKLSAQADSNQVHLARIRELEQHLHNALGAMDSLAHQIDQMRGMFRDEDGAIEKSIDDYEATAAEIRAVLQPNTSARKHLNPGRS